MSAFDGAPGPNRQHDAADLPDEATLLPRWKVILHNDDENSFDAAIHAVETLTPLRDFEAMRHVLEAHVAGLSMLLTTHRERAELYQLQFASRNLTVTIEPADD